MGGTSTASGKFAVQHAELLAGSLVLTASAMMAPSRGTRRWHIVEAWVLGAFAMPTVFEGRCWALLLWPERGEQR